MRIYSITIRQGSARAAVSSDGSLSLSEILASEGFVFPVDCGRTGRCGKCRVRVIGEITGDAPDESGTVRACLAYPRSDLTVLLGERIPQKHTAPRVTLHASPTAPSEKAPQIRTGLAFDVGTTTLVASLTELCGNSLRRVATAVCRNPQSVYGADVLTRVSASEHSLDPLCASLLSDLSEMATALGAVHPVTPTRAVFTGNTVMLHLLCGISPAPIGRYPYAPVFRTARTLPSSLAGIPKESTYVFPTASGFVGGDLLAGVLTLMDTEVPTLLSDLGTNCEMALIVPNEKDPLPTVYATSAAAGPAMEGGNLSCGMGALDGAICRVRFDGMMLRTETVGNASPAGLCGSGLFDAVALLRRYGAIDDDGVLSDDEIPEDLSERMQTDADGEPCFTIGNAVFLTQSDIRAFQLAKSAVRCGAEVLCETADLQNGSVGRVALAGAFGEHLDPTSVFAVGLFPKEFRGGTEAVGNSALRGAELCLFSEESRRTVEALADRTRVIDLDRSEGFEHRFLRHLSFP